MTGNPEVVACLSDCLKAELTAINQYFLHSKMCENWGYLRLAKDLFKESVEEMKHAEKLVERILFLDGYPNMTDLFPIKIGAGVQDQLENDLATETDSVARLNRGISVAVDAGDTGSRELFESILTGEEEHIDWLEAQLHLIEEVGLDKYLAQQIHKDG